MTASISLAILGCLMCLIGIKELVAPKHTPPQVSYARPVYDMKDQLLGWIAIIAFTFTFVFITWVVVVAIGRSFERLISIIKNIRS